MTTSSPPGPDEVAAARKVLDDVVLHTPMLHSRALSEQLGGPVYLKCENLQRTGSFKARGAYLRIWRLSDAQRARGVIAASAGNHAQGVAFAAARLGARARASSTVLPCRTTSAPYDRVASTLGSGARSGMTTVARAPSRAAANATP